MRLHQTKKLLHSKRNHQQSEKGLTDMNNSLVMAGPRWVSGVEQGISWINGNRKQTNKP